MSYDYDLFVIGAGSGGVRAARMSAAYGATVAVAEDTYLGGTCVNVGCVPKKLFVYGSHYHEDFADAQAFGWNVSAKSFEWDRLRDNKTQEILRLQGIYQRLLDDAGVTTHHGTAHLADEHTVVMEQGIFSAERILVATGSWPTVPDIPGREHVITSNEAFYLDSFPSKVVVVGGGYIAVEFAGIFAGLGADTQLLYRGPLFLRGFDEGVRRFVAAELEKKGIELSFDTNVVRVESSGGHKVLELSDGQRIEADLVMYATGRAPKVEGLGLQDVGVAMADNGAIRVNEHYQSSVPSIYALGDVIDRVQLTPVAIAEAMHLARHLFTEQPPAPVAYENIPTAVFSQPNIGTVGPTEEVARERFPQLQVYESEFRALKHTLSGRDERTLMKLLVDGASDRVVAAHMVGLDAGEIIQGIGVAITAGASKADFDDTIGIHPTSAEEFVTMREVAR